MKRPAVCHRNLVAASRRVEQQRLVVDKMPASSAIEDPVSSVDTRGIGRRKYEAAHTVRGSHSVARRKQEAA